MTKATAETWGARASAMSAVLLIAVPLAVHADPAAPAIDPTAQAAVDLVHRGELELSKGQYDTAIQDLDRAIGLVPDFAVAFNDRGFAYESKGQFDRAIQDLDRAISLQPNLAIAYNNRGQAYMGKGQNDRAIQDFDRATSLQPELAIAFSSRGQDRRRPLRAAGHAKQSAQDVHVGFESNRGLRHQRDFRCAPAA